MTTIAILLPIATHALGSNTVQTVNARNLYAFLSPKRDFSPWVKAQIRRGKFIEGRDYTTYHEDVVRQNQGLQKIDYHMSFDMAKHIAMMSNADKGHEVREYFLDCERFAQEKRTAPVVRDPAIQMLIDMAVHLDEARTLASEAKTIAQQALDTQQWLTIREYVFLNTLDRQMPPSYQQEDGKYLTGYCLENGIPVRKQPIADRQYGAEHAYHVGTIEKTLPGTDADGNSTTRDPSPAYLLRRKRRRG